MGPKTDVKDSNRQWDRNILRRILGLECLTRRTITNLLRPILICHEEDFDNKQ